MHLLPSQAVKEALKILENGGSVEDAKAVCEPNVLNQLMRWKVCFVSFIFFCVYIVI